MRQQYRLTKGADFKQVYGSGRSIADRTLVLYRLPRAGELRIGISVSKKVAASSVRRNHLKRLVRESFREVAGRIAPGYHLVIIVRVAAKGASFAQVRESLIGLLQRAGILARTND